MLSKCNICVNIELYCVQSLFIPVLINSPALHHEVVNGTGATWRWRLAVLAAHQGYHLHRTQKTWNDGENWTQGGGGGGGGQIAQIKNKTIAAIGPVHSSQQ